MLEPEKNLPTERVIALLCGYFQPALIYLILPSETDLRWSAEVPQEEKQITFLDFRILSFLQEKSREETPAVVHYI